MYQIILLQCSSVQTNMIDVCIFFIRYKVIYFLQDYASERRERLTVLVWLIVIDDAKYDVN